MPRKLNKNWILSWAEAIDPHTMAPRQYCIWSAISAIGAILKDHTWINYGPYKIKPNQYIVLTGEPGIGKGEAIHPVYNMVKDLQLINVISDRCTAPKIIERMAQGFPSTQVIQTNGTITLAKESSATLFSTELPTLITSSDWMLQFLCDAWDRGEFYYDTKNNGNATIKGMCTSLIGGCVPEYIRRLNRDANAAVNGGFTARTIFVYAEERSKNLPFPSGLEDTQRGRTLIDALKDDLLAIAQLHGEYKLSDSARIEYIRFYNSINLKDDDSDVVRHFKRRYHIHVLKLSMIFQASDNDSQLIHVDHMRNAIICVRDILKNLDKTFRGVGESELAEGTARVQSFIEKKGVTSRQEIMSNLHRHITPENLDRILSVMIGIQFCEYKIAGGRQLIHQVKKSSGTVINTTSASFTYTNGVNGANGKTN